MFLRKLFIVSIYGAAVFLRTWQVLSVNMTGDNATVGLTIQAVLQGEFPWFFLGGNYMGGLDAFLAAPLVAFSPPSSLAIAVLCAILSLGIMACLQPVLRKTLGYGGMLAGLAYLAIPPATWLYWSGEARTHYTMGLFLCALLLWWTFKLWNKSKWKLYETFVWGVIAGASVWTIFASAVVVLPCGLFLIVTGRGKIRISSIPLAIAGMLLGALPLIWYNVSHELIHTNQTSVFQARFVLPSILGLFQNAMPIVLGLDTPAAGGSLATTVYPYSLYLFILAVVVLGIFSLFKLAREKWTPIAILLLSIGLLNLMVVVSSAYSKQLFSPDQRYLLSLYLVLPFLVGAAIVYLNKWRSWSGIALVAIICIIHVSQYHNFSLQGQRLLNIKSGFYYTQERDYKKLLHDISAAGFKHVYADQGGLHMAYLSDGDPVVSDYWRHRWFTKSLEVDGAIDPGLINMPQGSLDLLGLPYQVWNNSIAHNFSQPAGAAVLLPRNGWSAWSDGKNLGSVLNDNNFETGYSTAGKANNNESITVDLGKSQPVGGLAMIPGEFRQVPRGLRVELADSDKRFYTVRQGKDYWGPFYLSGPHPFLKARFSRVESYFPVREVRYLRFTHLGQSNHPWSIRELLVFSPSAASPKVSWEQSANQIFTLLVNNNIKRFYGDAWIAAKVAQKFGSRIKTVTGNAAIDNFGTVVPPLVEPLMLNPETGSAMAVTTRAEAVVSCSLKAWGIKFQKYPAGRFAVFILGGRIMGAAIEAEKIKGLAEGPHQDIAIRLAVKEHAPIGWLELHNPRFPTNPMPGIEVQVSQDGRHWVRAPLQKAGPIVFTGQILLMGSGPKTLYKFSKPVSARQVRVLTSDSRARETLKSINLKLIEP
ncbi:MAG: hypothetical protein KQI62_03140 [Deltaproteobacteria bacterium]|nr:hypothetical protein [Deltaproteobacteria bacterium]